MENPVAPGRHSNNFLRSQQQQRTLGKIKGDNNYVEIYFHGRNSKEIRP